VVALANAAVAFGLTVTIVGIVGAVGAATVVVCAIAGNTADNINAKIVFFIL
jgi:hypothetical protein